MLHDAFTGNADEDEGMRIIREAHRRLTPDGLYLFSTIVSGLLAAACIEIAARQDPATCLASVFRAEIEALPELQSFQEAVKELSDEEVEVHLALMQWIAIVMHGGIQKASDLPPGG